MEITLNLQIGIYLDYFGFIFPKDPESGAYKLSVTSDLGRLLVAYIQKSDKPVKPRLPQDGQKSVTLQLPRCESTQHLCNKWLFVSAGDEARFEGALKAFFNMDLISYYQAARSMGYQKKEAIEMFCVSRKMLNIDPYESLHKRVYRAEIDKLTRLTQMLYNKVYNFERTLDKTNLYEKNC